MKKLLKAIGIVVTLALMFCAGRFGSSVLNGFRSVGGPHVYSDHVVREQIKEVLPSLPVSAHHLYYAIRGWQDADRFLACSVPEEYFSSLLAQVRELAQLRTHGQHPFLQDPIRHGPDSWPDYDKDPLWDLSTYSDIITETTNGMTTMYSPTRHRVFILLWGG